MNSTRRAMCGVMALLAGSGSAPAGQPVDTAFTYQGQLRQNGIPADGAYDLVFRLFDDQNNQVGTAVSLNDFVIANGLFSVDLDFGPGIFAGDRRELEVQVDGIVLTPRQPLNAAPYAMYALDGPGAVGAWAVNGAHIYKTNSGNVGIGTTAPAANLEIRGFSSPRLRVSHLIGELGAGGTGILELKSNRVLSGAITLPHGAVRFLDGDDVVLGSIQYSGLGFTPGMHFATNSTSRMVILPDGNIGVGTNSPTATLHATNAGGQTAIYATTNWIGVHGIHDSTSGSFPGVFGETHSNSSLASGVRGYVTSSTPGPNSAGVWGRNFGAAAIGSGVRGTHDGAGAGVTGESTNGYGGVFSSTLSGKGLLVFGETHLGKVGINTTSIPVGVQLAVDGKMLCEEVEVQLSQDWPDYVFEDDYALLPLDELEQLVRRQKHLPGVPSAAAVKSEGIGLGDMQVRLLEKVEELTLYVIQLNRKLEVADAENRALRDRVAAFELAGDRKR